MAVACFKGTVYESTRLFCETQLGEGATERILAELPKSDADALRSSTTLEWCPVEPVLAFHHAMERVYGTGDLSLCIKAGRFSAGWAFNTVLKVFLRFRSPRWLVDRATTVWGRYHDTGRWEIEEAVQKNRVVAHLYDFGVRDPAFCARLRGWLAGAVTLTGGSDPSVSEPRCACRGHGHCMFVLSWNE